MKNKSLFMIKSIFAFLLLFIIMFLPFIHAEELKVTSEHPFLMNGKWIPAYQLKIGDKLKTIDGKIARITNIEKIDEQVEVYNLESSYNDFVVSSGVIVHNSNRPLPNEEPTVSKRGTALPKEYKVTASKKISDSDFFELTAAEEERLNELAPKLLELSYRPNSEEYLRVREEMASIVIKMVRKAARVHYLRHWEKYQAARENEDAIISYLNSKIVEKRILEKIAKLKPRDYTGLLRSRIYGKKHTGVKGFLREADREILGDRKHKNWDEEYKLLYPTPIDTQEEWHLLLLLANNHDKFSGKPVSDIIDKTVELLKTYHPEVSQKEITAFTMYIRDGLSPVAIGEALGYKTTSFMGMFRANGLVNKYLTKVEDILLKDERFRKLLNDYCTRVYVHPPHPEIIPLPPRPTEPPPAFPTK